MESLQNGCITIISRITMRNSEKNRSIRHVMVGVLFFVIMGISFISQMNYTIFHDEYFKGIEFLSGIRFANYNVIVAICSALLLLIVLLSTERIDKSKRWNFYFVTLFILFCLLVIIAGISHNIGEGYVFNYIMMMLILPLLSVAWSDADNLARVFDTIAIAIVVFIVIVTIIDIVFFPFGQISEKYYSFIEMFRYQGAAHHPNRFGEYPAIGCSACFYLIYRKKNYIVKALLALSVGMCFAQSVMTVSRTSISICILEMVLWLIFVIKRKISFKELIIVILIICLSSYLTYGLLTDFSDPLKMFSGIERQITVNASDDNKNGNSEEQEEKGSAVSKRFKIRDSIDGTFSGRFQIWKMCLNKMTWEGSDISYVYPFRVLNEEGTGYHYFSLMHNAPLEYALRCGIPAGIVFVLILLFGIAFCISVIFCKKDKMKDAHLFAVMGVLSFVIAGNVEHTNEPFIRVWLLMYYLALVPVFTHDFNLSKKLSFIKRRKSKQA